MGADILQQHRLEVVPYLLISIELRRIGGDALQPNLPVLHRVEKGPDLLAAVDASAIPNDKHLLFCKGQKSLEEMDDRGPLERVRAQTPEHLARGADGADDAEVLVAALLADDGRLPLGRIRFPDARQQANARFVHEKDYPVFVPGFFFIAGSRSFSHPSTFSGAWRLSTSRGFCRV